MNEIIFIFLPLLTVSLTANNRFQTDGIWKDKHAYNSGIVVSGA